MPDPQRLAEAIQAELKDAGHRRDARAVRVRRVSRARCKNGEHPMCLIGWSGDNGDPDNFYYPLLDQDSAHEGDAQNYAFWRDPAFHALMLAGQRTSIEAERAAIYMQASAMVHDQVPAISARAHRRCRSRCARRCRFRSSPDTAYHFELMTDGDANDTKTVCSARSSASEIRVAGSAARRARRRVPRPQSACADAHLVMPTQHAEHLSAFAAPAATRPRPTAARAAAEIGHGLVPAATGW